MDNEFKQSVINTVDLSSANPHKKVRVFRNKAAMISVSCIFATLLIGGPLILNKDVQKNHSPSTLISGFVITDYAADGTSLAVKPDVDFPLGQYSIYMSSVPGFPVTIVSKDAEEINVRTSEGELLLWNKSDSTVSPQGKETIVRSGDTIYWSPLVEGQAAAESRIELTAYKDKKALGSNVIEIESDDQGMYIGKATKE
ncbi:hypothetical protein EBB07_23005 [Paenibacillaceae bacterium]|nr:hypothetical protein EBB07_23005 [Paenibacillaceae bacterium]